MTKSTVREYEKRLKRQALLIEEQLGLISQILESLQTCLNQLHHLPKPPHQKTHFLAQSTTQTLENLIEKVFDQWAELEEEKDQIKNTLQRIKKFRD